MRVTFVPAVATHIVSNTQHPAGGPANGASSATGGDVFAQLLAALASGVGNPAAPAQPADATGAPDATKALIATSEPDAPSPTQATSPATPPATPSVKPVAAPSAPRVKAEAALSAKLATAPAPAAGRLAEILSALQSSAGSAPGASDPVAVGQPAEKPSTGKKPDVSPSNAVAHDDKPANANATTNTVPSPPIAVAEQTAPTTQIIATDTSPAPVGPVLIQNVPSEASSIAAPAPDDKSAAGIVPAGNTVKPSRSAKPDANAPAASNGKSQSQNSTAGTLAKLSTAANRSFADQNASTSQALNVPTPSNDKAAGSANDLTKPDTAHVSPSAPPSIPPDIAKAHVDASASTQATPGPHTTPAPQAVAADTSQVAAANGAVTSTPPAGHAPVRVDVQAAPASAHATPDLETLAVTIAAKSLAGARHFDIRLDPPELGRVDVRLSLDDAGKAQASLAVEKPQTLELLQKDSAQLERALKDAGVELAQNSLNFSLKGQQQNNGNGNAPTTRSRAQNLRAVAAIETSPSTTQSNGIGASHARLDIRV